MHRNKSVSTHQFAMIPRADIPRASFKMQRGYKTTFDSGYLIPVLCEEVLPGDSFKCRMTAFARMATPIFPVMDNIYLDSFFFFVPNRLVWSNWVRMMGEQDNPDDSISFAVPIVGSPSEGYPVGSIYDYFGLPTVGQVAPGSQVTHSALPLRMYNKIYNDWFRDENLQDSMPVLMDDGPDPNTTYGLKRRGKRHDYFTGCLPWPLKGGQTVGIPIGTTAPVITNSQSFTWTTVGGTPAAVDQNVIRGLVGSEGAVQMSGGVPSADSTGMIWGNQTGLIADLSSAAAATINQLRQAFQIQRLLERDARGGTRYIEIVLAHFGVRSPDMRLQRSEYLGGGTAPLVLNQVAQTSGTGDYTDTPLANLAAIGTITAHKHGFSQSFTEHGYVIGLVSVRADLSYQQGLRRHWSRRTRYDFYFPAFAMLGEQAVLQKEIYYRGDAGDDLVFGYQERWAEYRYSPSEITGLFRSTAAGTLDAWHAAQKFDTAPVLGPTFIEETPPIDRLVAVGAAANGAQFILDAFFDIVAARPMPLYSVPGMIDHF